MKPASRIIPAAVLVLRGVCVRSPNNDGENSSARFPNKLIIAISAAAATAAAPLNHAAG